MCERCENLKEEVKGKAVLDVDFYHSLLYDAGILSKSAITPSFEVDPSQGEGKATKEEIGYRQDLKKLIEQVWKNRSKLSDSELKDLIDSLFINNDSEGKQLAQDFITEVYDSNMQAMQLKLKKLGIKKKTTKNNEVFDALVNWQQFAIERMGVNLYYSIINERFGKAFFEAAYGS